MGIHIGKATSIFFQTLPWVALRLLFGIVFSVLIMAYFAFWLWVIFTFIATGTAVGMLTLIAAVAVFLIAFAGFYAFYRFIVRILMYYIKGGHIAVVAETVMAGAPPKSQLSFGFNAVKARFLSTGALAALDMVIEGVMRGFVGFILRIGERMPIQALRTLFRIIAAVVYMVVNYLDEAVLAYIFTRKGDAWAAAADGVTLYAKNWKPVTIAATLMVLLLYGITFVLFNVVFAAGIPFQSFFAGFGTFAVWAVMIGVTAILFLGILQPYVQTVIIVTYLEEVKGQKPDSATANWLVGIVPRFRELMSRAGGAISTPQAPAQAKPACAICGSTLVEGRYWPCAKCGRNVDAKCARTKAGKTYCLDDIKKMGMG